MASGHAFLFRRHHSTLESARLKAKKGGTSLDLLAYTIPLPLSLHYGNVSRLFTMFYARLAVTPKSALRGDGLWLRGRGLKGIPGVESCKSLFFGVELGEGHAVKWIAVSVKANKSQLRGSKRGLSPM